jgi:hypothetical protein
VRRRLLLLDGCHPPPHCRREGQRRVLLQVLRVAEQVLLDAIAGSAIVVVPGRTGSNKTTSTNLTLDVHVGLFYTLRARLGTIIWG